MQYCYVGALHGSGYVQGMDILERGHEYDQRAGTPLESTSGKERRPRAGTVQPGEEEALGGPTGVYKYLRGEAKEDGARLSSVVPSARAGGSGHKLEALLKCQEALLHSVGDRALAQVA